MLLVVDTYPGGLSKDPYHFQKKDLSQTLEKTYHRAIYSKDIPLSGTLKRTGNPKLPARSNAMPCHAMIYTHSQIPSTDEGKVI